MLVDVSGDCIGDDVLDRLACTYAVSHHRGGKPDPRHPKELTSFTAL
jgi:hypothetical protein